MNLKNYNSHQTVKLCKGNLCIEARGQNASALVLAACITLLLIGLAALARATR